MASNSRTDTRSRVLAVALELFSEHGFEGTSLQEIADRLGVTKAALYYHFRSKDELLQALVVPALTDLDDVLNAHETVRDTPARRREFIHGYIDYLLHHRQLIAYISRDLATLAHPAIAQGNRERRARIEALLIGADLEFNDQMRVAIAFGGIQAAIAQYPDADDAQLRDALLDAAATLLGPRRRTPQPNPRKPPDPGSDARARPTRPSPHVASAAAAHSARHD